MQHHKYSLTEIENLIPWERDIYVGLLNEYIEEEKFENQAEKRQFNGLMFKNLSLLKFNRLRKKMTNPSKKGIGFSEFW